MPLIAWQGFSELSAQDLRPQIVPKTTPIHEAVDFLQDFLKDGARPDRDVSTAASSRGISHSTLKRAKKRLGVIARKLSFDGGWSCALPAAEVDQASSNAGGVVPLDEGGVQYQGEGDGGTNKTKETNPPLRASSTDGTDDDQTREVA